jgi:hypothetical protein
MEAVVALVAPTWHRSFPFKIIESSICSIFIFGLQSFLEEAEAKKAADEKRTPQDWARQVLYHGNNWEIEECCACLLC